MANIIGNSPVARTTTLARTMVSGSVFGVGRTSLVTPFRPQPTQELVSSNQATLSLVSNQLIGFTKQMQDIGGALEKIAYYIAIDSGLEQQRERQKEFQNRRLAEEAVRDEREGIIERKIQSVISAPVQAIAQKAQGVLSRLMGFFSSLLLGWLLNQGIEAIKGNAEGAKNKLEEIKDNVLSTLGVAFKIFYLIRSGFLTFARTVTNIALKLGKFIVSDVIGGIFKGVFNLGKGIVNAGKNLIGKGTQAAAAATAATKATQAATKGAGLLSRLTPGLGTAVNLGMAGYRFKEGDIPGAAMSALSSVPFIGIPIVAADVYRDFGGFKGTFLERKEATKAQQQAKANVKASSPALANAASPAKPQAQAQTPMTPSASSFGVDTSGMFESTFSSQTQQQDFTQAPLYGEMNIPQSQGPTQAQISPIAVNQMQRSQVTAPLPEPSPNVIVTRTSTQQNAGNVSNASVSGGPANDVPAISSSNPENFYTLYSQIHYNIVT